MIWNVRASLETDLERFFRQMNGAGSADFAPHASAFSKARRHLKASAFRSLNDLLIELSGEHGLRDERWHGLRLLAIDGSTLRLPKAAPEITDYFGGSPSNNGTFLPLAQISFLYDVQNHLIVDAVIAPYQVAENVQAFELVRRNLGPSDCSIYDRGYSGPKIIASVLAQKSHFVIRMSLGKSKQVCDFLESGEEQAIFPYEFDDDLIGDYGKAGLSVPKHTSLRLIRVALDTGETEVLLTNLTDHEKYPLEEFKDLYHTRWGVEEGFKTFKCQVEVENWTGKSVVSIEQDFYARILSQNIAASMAEAVQPILEKRTRHRKHSYQVNGKRALGVIRDEFCKLIGSGGRIAHRLLDVIMNRLMRSPSIVRPGRSFPHHTSRRVPPAPPCKPIS